MLSVSLAAAVAGNLHSLTAITKLTEPPTWYIVSTLLGLWAGFFGAAWLAIVGAGDPQPGPGPRACGSAGSTWSACPSGWAARSWWP